MHHSNRWPNSELKAALKDVTDLQQALGYDFNDLGLLELAVTHESFSNEHEHHSANNERLEFLGDSILGAVVCEYLYSKHPDLAEGPLAQVKSFVVSTTYLAEKAREIGLGDYLKLGKGEHLSSGRERSNVLADTFEAVVGAMYLDGGWEPVRKFVLSKLKMAMDNLEGAQRDFKSLLQEYTQRYCHRLPVYKVVKESGPPHERTFTLQVSLGGHLLGEGTERAKQSASQIAAHKALELLRRVVGFDLDMMTELELTEEDGETELETTSSEPEAEIGASLEPSTSLGVNDSELVPELAGSFQNAEH